MADKKVERYARSSEIERPQTPTQKLQAEPPEPGALNLTPQEESKKQLLDRFRERETRLREEHNLESPAEGKERAPET